MLAIANHRVVAQVWAPKLVRIKRLLHKKLACVRYRTLAERSVVHREEGAVLLVFFSQVSVIEIDIVVVSL